MKHMIQSHEKEELGNRVWRLDPGASRSKSNVPTPGTRPEVKCPTEGIVLVVKSRAFARTPPPPRGIYIDRCISLPWQWQSKHLERACPKWTTQPSYLLFKLIQIMTFLRQVLPACVDFFSHWLFRDCFACFPSAIFACWHTIRSAVNLTNSLVAAVHWLKMKKTFFRRGNEWISTNQIDSAWEFVKAVSDDRRK